MTDQEKMDAMMGAIGKLADTVGKLAEKVEKITTVQQFPAVEAPTQPLTDNVPAPKRSPAHQAPVPQQAPPIHNRPQVIGRIDTVQKSAADGVRSGPAMDMTIRVMQKMEELSMGGQGTVASDAAIWNPRVPNKKAREENYGGRDIKPVGEKE